MGLLARSAGATVSFLEGNSMTTEPISVSALEGRTN